MVAGRGLVRALEQRLRGRGVAGACADVAEDLERVRLVAVALQDFGAGALRLAPGAGFVSRDGAAAMIFVSDDVVSLGTKFLASGLRLACWTCGLVSRLRPAIR